MAQASNWVKRVPKMHGCSLDSWGLGFPDIPVGPPSSVCFTLKRNNVKTHEVETLEVRFDANEVEKLYQTCADFRSRGGK